MNSTFSWERKRDRERRGVSFGMSIGKCLCWHGHVCRSYIINWKLKLPLFFFKKFHNYQFYVFNLLNLIWLCMLCELFCLIYKCIYVSSNIFFKGHACGRRWGISSSCEGLPHPQVIKVTRLITAGIWPRWC